MAKKMKKEKIPKVNNAEIKGENEEVSTFTKLRTNRKFRLGLILGLMAIVAVLFVFFEKLRIVLAVAFIALLAAFGLEVTQNDWDLGELLKTKSFEESKVSRDESGNILFDKEGNITTDSSKGKRADEYNCDDFSAQPQAQSFFYKAGGTDNDLNRLDGDNDGDACEGLPQNK